MNKINEQRKCLLWIQQEAGTQYYDCWYGFADFVFARGAAKKSPLCGHAKQTAPFQFHHKHSTSLWSGKIPSGMILPLCHMVVVRMMELVVIFFVTIMVWWLRCTLSWFLEVVTGMFSCFKKSDFIVYVVTVLWAGGL